MIWRIIGLVGAGTFLVNGYKVLIDPNCDGVLFEGGRVLQYSCYSGTNLSGGEVSGNLAGLGMMLVGVLITFFVLRRRRRF